MTAIAYDRIEIVQTLIEAGANLNLQNNYGKTAFDFSYHYFHTRNLIRAQYPFWHWYNYGEHILGGALIASGIAAAICWFKKK